MLATFLNQTRKAWESASHVGMAGRKPHPNIARYRNHRRSSTSRIRASASGSTCTSTRTHRRLPRSISIGPFRTNGTDRTRLSSFHLWIAALQFPRSFPLPPQSATAQNMAQPSRPSAPVAAR